MAEEKVSIIYQIKDLASQALTGIKGKLVSLGDAALNSAAKADRLKERLEGIGRIGQTAAIGAVVVTAALTAIGVSALKTSGQFEQWGIAFETMLGNKEKAKKLMDEMVAFSAKTPFNTSEVVEYSKRLLAMGITVDDIIPTVSMLGDIAAGVGTDKFPQLVLAYGQVQAATRLTGMELRQFTEAGVPLLDMLAQNMGKSAGEIQKMVGNGQIGFEDVREALSKLTAEGGKFHDLMGKQSKTLLGQLTNLQDSAQLLAKSIGDTLSPAVQVLTVKLTGLINYIRETPAPVKALLGVFLGGGVIIAGLVTALGGFLAIVPLVAAGAATIGLSLKMAFGVIPAVITAVVGLGFAVASNWKSIQKLTAEVSSTFVKFGKNYLQVINVILGKINELSAKIPGIPKLNLNVDGAVKSLERLEKEYDSKSAKFGLEIKATELKKQAATGDTADSNKGFTQKVKSSKGAEDEKKSPDFLKNILDEHEAYIAELKKLDEYSYQKEIQNLERIKNAHAKTAEDKRNIQKEIDELILKDKIEIGEKIIKANEILLETEKQKGAKFALDEIERQRANLNELLDNKLIRQEQHEQHLTTLNKERADVEKQNADSILGMIQGFGDTRLSIEQQFSQGFLDLKKNEYLAQIDGFAAAESSKLAIAGAAKLGMMDFIGSAFAFSQMAVVLAAAATAKTAINSIKLAEGGVVMPRSGGVTATIGERGPEAVVPLEKMAGLGGDIVINLTTNLDGKTIAKNTWKHQRSMIKTGEISA